MRFIVLFCSPFKYVILSHKKKATYIHGTYRKAKSYRFDGEHVGLHQDNFTFFFYKTRSGL